jgi:hypothetical protein
MKNPPTLADACIATALDKRMAARSGDDNAEMRGLLLKVAHARKFVLDDSMSKYLYDLSHTLLRGGLRKRIYQIENTRQLARLPHPLTWIEFNHRVFIERGRELGHKTVYLGSSVADVNYQRNNPHSPERRGWLLQQHPKIETAFIASEAFSSVVRPGHGLILPVSVAWCSDNLPLPWRTFDLLGGGFEELSTLLLAGIPGYKSTQVGWTCTFSEKLSTALIRESGPFGARPSMSVRDLWVLLATINDLPIKIEHVEPSKGYVARGAYKKFLAHSIIHLTVPETRWYKLIRKVATILRRRAHQVRGHWRVDWRARPIKGCEHIWNEDMICSKCSGHMLWIAEHQRGDASLGFVTHDYSVEHEEKAPT